MQRGTNLRKMLTIYYLIDTGAQMVGDKIGSINSAMEEAITVDLPDISTANDDAEIRVAIIQFSTGASWVTPGTVPVGELIWNDLHASGANDFGQALRLLEEDLISFNPRTNFAPVILAFSNAPVTDEYTEILKRLDQMDCFRKGHKIGISIGSDADKKALEAFAGSRGSVIAVNDKHTLKALMRKTDIEESSMIDLKAVITNHPYCIKDRASLRAVLLDLYPNEKLMINVLSTIYESGLPQRISTLKELGALTLESYISLLEDSYGIIKDHARNGLLLWAEAYDVAVCTVKQCKPEPMDLWSDQAQSLYKKYFVEDNHKYSIGGLTINTKFASFAILTTENGVPTNRIKLFGYEYFVAKYSVEGDAVSIYMQGIDDPDKIHPVATVSGLEISDIVELMTILEFMATFDVKEQFSYAFDETIEPYMVPNTNNYFVMRNHFSGEFIKPLQFSARCTKKNDLPKETESADLGYGMYTFAVENKSGTTWGYKDMQRRNAKVLKIVSPKAINGSIEEETIYLDRVRDDVFINTHTNSVFIGSPHDYTQFQCDDLETAYKVFDYLVILFQRTI